MSSAPKTKGLSPRRKLLLLIASIFIIPVLVTIAWYVVADGLKSTIEAKISELSISGKTATCNNLEMRGFPFRIGVNCTHTAFDDNKQQVGFAAGEFRTAAQIYRPGHIVSELDGPMQITSKTAYLEADWENLQTSAVLDLSGISRTSFKATQIKTQIIEPKTMQIGSILSENLEIHMRQNEKDLDFATNAQNVSFLDKSGKTTASNIQIGLVTKLINQAATLEFGRDILSLNLQGTAVDIEQFALDIGDGGKIIASGPIKFSGTGLITGQLDMRIENSSIFLKRFEPYARQNGIDLNMPMQLLSAFSNGGDNLNIKLDIKDGVVRAGLFPIGFIPAI